MAGAALPSSSRGKLFFLLLSVDDFTFIVEKFYLRAQGTSESIDTYVYWEAVAVRATICVRTIGAGTFDD